MVSFVIKCIGLKLEYDFWFENGLGVLVTEYLHGFWAAKKKKGIF